MNTDTRNVGVLRSSRPWSPFGVSSLRHILFSDQHSQEKKFSVGFYLSVRDVVLTGQFPCRVLKSDTSIFIFENLRVKRMKRISQFTKNWKRKNVGLLPRGTPITRTREDVG